MTLIVEGSLLLFLIVLIEASTAPDDLLRLTFSWIERFYISL